MRAFFIIVVFLIAQETKGQSLAELDSSQYFDFWVGEWVASWDEGNGVEQLGVNTITKSLDGKVIVENFRIEKGQSRGFKGTSISVFQPRLKRWKQAWADNQGGYFDFTGSFEGEKRIFETDTVKRGELEVKQRMVFYDIQADSMTWDWELSRDGGETWELQWRVMYSRKDL